VCQCHRHQQGYVLALGTDMRSPCGVFTHPVRHHRLDQGRSMNVTMVCHVPRANNRGVCWHTWHAMGALGPGCGAGGIRWHFCLPHALCHSDWSEAEWRACPERSRTEIWHRTGYGLRYGLVSGTPRFGSGPNHPGAGRTIDFFAARPFNFAALRSG